MAGFFFTDRVGMAGNAAMMGVHGISLVDHQNLVAVLLRRRYLVDPSSFAPASHQNLSCLGMGRGRVWRIVQNRKENTKRLVITCNYYCIFMIYHGCQGTTIANLGEEG